MSLRGQQLGELIAQAKGSIKRLDYKSYVVNSQSGNGSYNIELTESASIVNPLNVKLAFGAVLAEIEAAL